MTALAGDIDRDPVGRGHHGPRADTHRAGRHRRRVVHAEHRLCRKTLKKSVLNHRFGTGKALFTGLKNQHRRAVKVARLCQIARRPDQHGRVTVMTAAVHQAGLARLPGKIVVLGHGQRVHVGAQGHHLAAAVALALDQRHDAGLANARVNLVDAALFQGLLHP